MPDAAASRNADALLAEELFAAVGALRRHARRSAGQPWPTGSLSGAQVELVRLVRRRPGTSVAEAAAELGVAANTVSTLVGQLTDRGLLRRTLDASDRRVARLELTAAARRRLERWRDRRSAIGAQAVGDLSPADRRALARAIPVIADIAKALRHEPSEEPND